MAPLEPSPGAIAARYRTFAAVEATGRSPLYATFANGIADDPQILGFLATLPPAKQQPNLLLGAMRFLYGTASDWPQFRQQLLDRRDAVEAVMRSRATQTNEPARCATLLPLLAQLKQPIALIEVGASSGLCLLPDRYAYDFDGVRLAPTNPPADLPVFACRVNPAVPVPYRLPQIAWRAGLDLNPIDPRDAEATRWLEALVWPGQERRLELLRAALKLAAVDPPRVVRGDLRTDLAALAAEAPSDATLVVFHTAVLSYISAAAERAAFARTLRDLDALWICNEGAGVFPEIRDRAPSPRSDMMLMALNGRPIAWADPHGASLDWFGPARPLLDWA